AIISPSTSSTRKKSSSGTSKILSSLLCDCSTQIGQTIKLTCRVLGFPKPVVSWIKVQHGARCSLTILCPEGEDSGTYTCFTHNDSGQASCEAQLTVEEGQQS
uniref:Ig-like domain-containing protein n=1 Tax=Xiphophorus maculatus TaxID=8083 RepID=A0A3B5QYG3_XIPMA